MHFFFLSSILAKTNQCNLEKFTAVIFLFFSFFTKNSSLEKKKIRAKMFSNKTINTKREQCPLNHNLQQIPINPMQNFIYAKVSSWIKIQTMETSILNRFTCLHLFEQPNRSLSSQFPSSSITLLILTERRKRNGFLLIIISTKINWSSQTLFSQETQIINHSSSSLITLLNR